VQSQSFAGFSGWQGDSNNKHSLIIMKLNATFQDSPRQRLSRILRFSFCFLLTSLPASATNYYVSMYGSDTNNDGLTVATPFRNIRQAAKIMLPGDTCYIRGGTYRETVTPTNSGVSGQPITYRAYDGEQVTISGADVVQGWSLDSGSTYKASMDWDLGHGNNQVFLDSESTSEARWPEPSDCG
jgi:hypothetical protein